MLFDHARLVAGQSVLIHGAAGNVGRFAVQLAREAGLRVLGTASPQDRDAVRALGADVVIGRDLATDEKVDAALDLVGGNTQARLFDLVRPGGVLISAVSEPGATLAAERSIRSVLMLVDVRTNVLGRLGGLFDRGVLRTFVGSVVPLSDAATAHRMLEGLVPRKPGKIVLHVR